MKKYTWLLAALLLLVALARPAGAVVLLNHDAALKAMFPNADKVVTEDKALTADQIAAVKGLCGDKWTLYQSGAKTEEVAENDTVSFYFGTKDGKKTGVALVEVQPGKWGPVKYVVAMDLAGKVTDLAVMSYVEQRGRPIATKRFLGQFIGKTVKSPVTVGKDVDAVSGATISSRATAFAVKKAIALYATVYLSPEEE
ncbi:MAG: FMN-binding protein [candidate division WOR-3 bacterium]|nr:FMN-binding protein [candidate division WOR-3 bacterium]